MPDEKILKTLAVKTAGCKRLSVMTPIIQISFKKNKMNYKNSNF
jgi:hypothetical protein